MSGSSFPRTARLGAIASIFMIGCAAHADKAEKVEADTAGKVAPSRSPSSSTTPESRGRAILQAQLGAVKEWSDPAPMDATFTRSAFLLLPNGEWSLAEAGSIASAIGFLNPHSTVKEATFDHFTSGGNTSVSWFTAELHFTETSAEPGYAVTSQKHTVRAVELLDGAADWKVAVAAFTNVSKLQPRGSCPIQDATPPGPLVNLLVTPDALASALDPAAVVLGTDPSERGAGPDAKTLVGKWNQLKFSLDTAQKAREVHTATYGYGMTNVKLAPTKPGGSPQVMSAFVLALPGPNGAWSVIAASYGATF